MSAAVNLEQVASPAVADAVAFDEAQATKREQAERARQKAIAEIEAEHAATEQALAEAEEQRQADRDALLQELGAHWAAKVAAAVAGWELAPSKHTAADVSAVILAANADIAAQVAVRVKVKEKVLRHRPQGLGSYMNLETVERHVPYEYLNPTRKLRKRQRDDGIAGEEVYDAQTEAPTAVRHVRAALGATGEFRGEPFDVMSHAASYDEALIRALDNPARLHGVLSKWSVDLS